MRTLVTGITGFAGGHLAEALLQSQNTEVFGLSLLPEWPALWAHLQGRVRLTAGDLCDAPLVEAVLRDVQPQHIYHVAGYPHTGRSFKEPDAAWSGNLIATRTLYEAVLRWGGRPRILFVGSGLIYGDPETAEQAYDETCLLRPTSPYAASKAAADLASYQYAHAPGLDIVRARPFNHIGPRQAPQFAVAHFAQQLAVIQRGLQPPVLETGNLTPRRDLTDVRDVVRAYMLLIEQGRTGEAYNIGTGQTFSMQEILDRLVALAGVQVEVRQRSDLVRSQRPRGRPGRRRQDSPRGGLDAPVHARSNSSRYPGLLETTDMKIAVIGTGYVGLVTATCLAESGNDVVGIDKDAAKIARLQEGQLPIYEPGLLELVLRNIRDNRLHFTTDLPQGIASAEVVFIAVGTPQANDGSADLSSVWAVGDAIAENLDQPKIIVIKSTVPVGTNRALSERLARHTSQTFDVASNPEFLKEGAALDDFMKPDRVVVGVRRPEVAEVLHELHAPFLRTERPFLAMSPESAEMTKYVANAMLATKISFINEMANLCERLGADINDVRRGIGHDARIGFPFLFPGAGYGGSCFPKDVRALIAMGKQLNLPLQIMQAVDQVNEAQKRVLVEKVRRHYGATLKEKTLAVWGLAFKPRTDDIRDAPALTLLEALLGEGVPAAGSRS